MGFIDVTEKPDIMKNKKIEKVKIDESLKKGERLVYKRDDKGNIKEVIKTDKTFDPDVDCWVVTAYYNSNPNDINVILIRNFRDNHIANPIYGKLVKRLDILYKSLYRYKFAKWWRGKLSSSENDNLIKVITGVLCKLLLVAAKYRKK